MSASTAFDRSRLKLKPLAERESDLDITIIKNLEPKDGAPPEISQTASSIRKAHENGSAVIMIIGAHVIRSGVQRYLIDMIDRGYITLLAFNGAGVIHDFELAMKGSTTESVARYISEGQFGLWEETALINDIVNDGYKRGLGLGEAVGRAINEGVFPNADISLFAACGRRGVPATVHVGIGQDITHEHPNCDGAAYGATSYADFLRFAAEVEKLEGGVLMNFGSAVTGPEIFLKALAMARNVAHSDGKSIRDFTTLVCDLQPVPADYRTTPPKSDPAYYFRPLKTLLARTVDNGGQSLYVQGNHADTIPWLWTSLTQVRK